MQHPLLADELLHRGPTKDHAGDHGPRIMKEAMDQGPWRRPKTTDHEPKEIMDQGPWRRLWTKDH